MTSWSIDKSELVEDKGNGKYLFGQNKTGKPIDYTITYTDDSGRCGEISYTLPSCEVPCNFAQGENIIPATPPSTGVTLFTLDKNCGNNISFGSNEYIEGQYSRQDNGVITAKVKENTDTSSRNIDIDVTIKDGSGSEVLFTNTFHFTQSGKANVRPQPTPQPGTGSEITFVIKNNSNQTAYFSGQISIMTSKNPNSIADSNTVEFYAHVCPPDCISTNGYNTKQWLRNHYSLAPGSSSEPFNVNTVDGQQTNFGDGTWYFVANDYVAGSEIMGLAVKLKHAKKKPEKIKNDSNNCPRCVNDYNWYIHVQPVRDSNGSNKIINGNTYYLNIDWIDYTNGDATSANLSTAMPTIQGNCCKYGDGDTRCIS